MSPEDRLARGLRSLVTRGRIVAAALNPKRCLLQVSGLAGEVKDNIELMLPYGRSAYPLAGGSVILLQVGGSRSHLVALLGDDASLRIPDLQPSEFGDRDTRAQQIVFRENEIEITTSLNVVATVGGSLTATVSGATTITGGAPITLKGPTSTIVVN